MQGLFYLLKKECILLKSMTFATLQVAVRDNTVFYDDKNTDLSDTK